MAPRAVKVETLAQVVSLSEARFARRLDGYRARLDKVLKANKRSLTRMFASGLLFTRQGTRAGRDLLTAHEHLLRAMTLLGRLANQGDIPAPRRKEEVDAIFDELDTLLVSTAQLTEQTTALLTDMKKD